MDMVNSDNISFCDVIKITQIATNIIKIMSIDSDILKHYLNTKINIDPGNGLISGVNNELLYIN